MKKVIPLILWFLLFTACDNRDEAFFDLDTAPVLSFEKPHAIEDDMPFMIDSVKTSPPTSAYLFRLLIQDQENNVSTFSYEFETGSGQLEYLGLPVMGTAMISGDNQKLELTYLPKSELSIILITVQDKIGKFATVKLELRTFYNLAPVARVNISEFAINSKYEYLIDASASKDADEAFGGKIVRYRYNINSKKEIITSKNAIPVIFPGEGTYSVTVVVEDNDNMASDPVITKLTI